MIHTNRLTLRTLHDVDVSQTYLSWLLDEEITRFLEVRHSPPLSLAALLDFVRHTNADPHSLLLGIFEKDYGFHIGNIKLSPINVHHKLADIGFFIGEREYWGRGFASEAISALSDYAFQGLGVEKLSAGCYEENVGSAKALLKAGFVLEARLRAHVILDGKRMDKLTFGKLKGTKS